MTSVADLRLGVPLFLDLREVLFLAAREVLLLHLSDACVDLGIGHLDAHCGGFLVELGLLDEQRDHVVTDCLVVRRPLLRERLTLLLVGDLRPRKQVVHGGQRDVLGADDCNVAGRQLGAATAAAAAGEQARGQDDENERLPHMRKRRLGRLARGQHSSDQIERPSKFTVS